MQTPLPKFKVLCVILGMGGGAHVRFDFRTRRPISGSFTRECREKACRLWRSSSSEPWCAPALSHTRLPFACRHPWAGCSSDVHLPLSRFIQGFSLCHLVRLWPRRRGRNSNRENRSASISMTQVADTETGRAWLERLACGFAAGLHSHFIPGGAIYDVI